uniref:Uncharacterized protein n=1 Tax=Lepeophtheirus salmonis TaxID=72036 RepID=A0A0K2UHP9_LEPSM
MSLNKISTILFPFACNALVSGTPRFGTSTARLRPWLLFLISRGG